MIRFIESKINSILVVCLQEFILVVKIISTQWITLQIELFLVNNNDSEELYICINNDKNETL